MVRFLFLSLFFVTYSLAQDIKQVERDYVQFSKSKKAKFTVKYGEFKKSETATTLELKDSSKIIDSIAQSKFEVVYQENSSHGQVKSYILGDAKTGQLFYFKFPNKLTKLQWQKPWKSEKKVDTLNAHFKSMTNPPITKGGE